MWEWVQTGVIWSKSTNRDVLRLGGSSFLASRALRVSAPPLRALAASFADLRFFLRERFAVRQTNTETTPASPRPQRTAPDSTTSQRRSENPAWLSLEGSIALRAASLRSQRFVNRRRNSRCQRLHLVLRLGFHHHSRQ